MQPRASPWPAAIPWTIFPPMEPIRIVIAVLLLATAACSELFTEPFDYGTVEVSTERTSGGPARGVHLVLYSGTRVLDQGYSDEDGRLTFRLVPFGNLGVAAGTAGLSLRPSYQFVTFRMDEGGVQRVSFSFVPCEGSISIQVLDDASEPVQGAEVSVYSPERTVGTDFSDASGRHRFEGLPCGNYGAHVRAPSGYTAGTSFIDGLEVEDGALIEVVFTLSFG
jgi:hypothetical protein